MVDGLANELGDLGSPSITAEFPTAVLGSPAAYGLSFQAGSVTLGAGSTGWAVFGRAFASVPRVMAMYQEIDPGGATYGVAGSRVGTGSVLLVGQAASQAVDWIAIGSGRA